MTIALPPLTGGPGDRLSANRILAVFGGELASGGAPSLSTRLRLIRIPSVPRLLTWLLIAAATVYLVGFAIASVPRLTYPYPLEVTEGASLDVLRHIVNGLPVYGPPTLSYVPVAYPPLYFYLAAVLAYFTGPTFLPLRLVSLLASAGGAALIFAIVRRETNSRTFGLVSAGLFAGSSQSSLTSLDLAGVDALGAALMLAALWAMRTADLRPDRARRACAIAGLFAALSAITRQTDAVLAVALLGYAALWPRTRLLPYGLTLAASVGLPLVVLYAQAGEWTRFYVVDLPIGQVLDAKQLNTFWTENIFPHLTLPLVIAPLVVVGRVVRGELRTAGFFALASVSLLFVAWLGWAGRGGAQNVLEPAYVALCLMFGLGLWAGRELLAERTQGHTVLRNYLLALGVVQFLILGYNPRATVPFRSDGWAGDRLTATIGSLPGTILAPNYSAWTLAAGKGDQPSTGALLQMTGAFAHTDNPIGEGWRNELSRALQARQYDYVLWDPHSDVVTLKSQIEANKYVDVGSLFKSDDEFNIWKTSRTPDVEVYVPAERASTFKPT